jgi:hypothetical protein
VDVWVAILPVNGPILGVSGVSADQTPGCLVARMGHRLGDEVSKHEARWAVRAQGLCRSSVVAPRFACNHRHPLGGVVTFELRGRVLGTDSRGLWRLVS